MKTILSLLLVLFAVSCSNNPPSHKASKSPAAADSAKFAEVPPLNGSTPKMTDESDATRTNVEAQPPAKVTALKNAETGPAGSASSAAAAPTPEITARGPGASTNAANPFARPAPPAIPPVTSTAPTNAVPREEMVAAGMIDFRATPLDQVLQVYADFVGRTLLRPANLGSPQVTLQTKTPLTRSEVIQALDAVLGMNGITMMNIGDKFVKAVPQGQAHTEGAPTDPRDATDLPDFGQYVTHVVQLKYVKPTEIVQALQPFAKMPNPILPVDSSQIIILRDYTENVKRMLEMIQRIDIAVPAEFVSEVIPIKYAKASEIADALNSLGGGGGGSTSIGRSSSPGARPAVGNPNSRPGGMNPGGYNQGYNQQGGIGSPGGGAAAPGGGSFTDRLQQIIRKASTSGDLQILGSTKMIADERSNSLLIFATRGDLEMIKNVVSKLDVVLSQVLIETIILDVSLNNAQTLGFSAVQTPKDFTGDVSGAGGMNAQTFFNRFGTDSSSGDTNVFSDLLGTGLRYFAKVDQNYFLQVQAAASEGRVNVIQKPRILTSHATPGSIFIGRTVPYVTSTYYGGGYSGPSSSYQQLQVGIGLTVTPYINPDGLVVMQIDETIDELAGSTDITGVGAVPNTTSRKFSAEVAVRDGDSIILGGFIRNATQKNNSGVPLLKDIPLLGALFSSHASSKDRSELLVLMRPTVLKTPDIAALATLREKSQMPGVRNAEAEVIQEENKLLQQENKRSSRHKSSAPSSGKSSTPSTDLKVSTEPAPVDTNK
jgi:general secretion pathway protein D